MALMEMPLVCTQGGWLLGEVLTGAGGQINTRPHFTIEQSWMRGFSRDHFAVSSHPRMKNRKNEWCQILIEKGQEREISLHISMQLLDNPELLSFNVFAWIHSVLYLYRYRAFLTPQQEFMCRHDWFTVYFRLTWAAYSNCQIANQTFLILSVLIPPPL